MPEYLRMHVSLAGIQPPIYREFLIPAEATFQDLHYAIQACGWGNCHLWGFTRSTDADTRPAIEDPPNVFRLPGARRGPPPVLASPDYEGRDPDEPLADQVPVREHFTKPDDSCLYIYDFGDDWQHDVRLKGIETHNEVFPRRLLAGNRSFPPEDVGSIPGYERAVAFRTTGKDPWGEDESLDEWLGIWEPEGFDMAEEAECFEDTRGDRAMEFGI